MQKKKITKKKKKSKTEKDTDPSGRDFDEIVRKLVHKSPAQSRKAKKSSQPRT